MEDLESISFKWNKTIPPVKQVLIGTNKQKEIFFFMNFGENLYFITDHNGFTLDYPKIKKPTLWVLLDDMLGAWPKEPSESRIISEVIETYEDLVDVSPEFQPKLDELIAENNSDEDKSKKRKNKKKDLQPSDLSNNNEFSANTALKINNENISNTINIFDAFE